MRLSTACFNMMLLIPKEQTFKMIKDAGFECIDFDLLFKEQFLESELEHYYLGDDYLEKAKEMRELIDKSGLICNQAHAPYCMEYGEPFDESCPHFKELVRALEVASILGAPHAALHPIRTPTYEEMRDYNREFFKALIPYCEKFNIKIALESSHLKYWVEGKRRIYLSSGQDFDETVLEVGSPYIVTLVDTGHAAGNGINLTTEDYIENMSGDLLAGLHVQDCDYLHDNHTTPFFQHLNWDKIMKALSDIGYKGDLTYEDVNVHRYFPVELTEATLKYRATVGRYLIDIFNKYELEKGR